MTSRPAPLNQLVALVVQAQDQPSRLQRLSARLFGRASREA